MAHQVPTLPASSRDKLGTRYSKRLRAEGRLPVVLYGHGEDPSHLHVDRHETTKLLNHAAHLLTLDVDGKSESCLVKSVQYDHLGDKILHLDLTRVDLTEEVELEIYLEFKGEPEAALEEGFVVSHPTQSVNIKCRADSIPENIEVNVEPLTLETPLTIADITLPAGVTITDDPETVVAAITFVQELPEPEEEEAAEGEEPEVIGEAAEGEEGGEGEAEGGGEESE